MTKTVKPGEDMVFNEDASLRLKKAHETIERPDKFADIFCSAAKTQTQIRDTIWEQIRVVLKTDTKARESLKEMIREVEKEELLIWGKKLWTPVWSVIMLILGALIGKYLR